MKFQIYVRQTIFHFSKQLKRAIAKGSHIIARLVPFSAKSKARVSGSARVNIRISAEFDAPLPEDVLRDFEG